MNPNARAHELMELALALIQVMATEIEALKNRRMGDVEAMQAQKATLSDLYHKHMQEIAADPSLLASVDPRVKAELKRLAEQLEGTARENERMVAAALKLNTGIVERIAQLAQSTQPSASGYTATGARPGAAYGNAPQVPVSVDKQF